MNSEIDPSAKLTITERAFCGLGLLSFILGLLLVGALCGCKSFYENSGSKVNVGTLTAPVEVSDSSDAITVRALYSMDGAAVWTAKDSKVTVCYDNVYTNTYIGCVDTWGEQHLKVEVEPLYVGERGETAAPESETAAPTNSSAVVATP